jgi:hypothetical protein
MAPYPAANPQVLLPLMSPMGIPITLPFAFVCTSTSVCTQMQQDMMTHMITVMYTMVKALSAVSIMEEALQKVSSMHALIRCFFGCNGIPEYLSNCLHLWRDCPNKNNKGVWENFQNNLQSWREKRKNSN